MNVELQFGFKWNEKAIWGRIYCENGSIYVERTNLNRIQNDSIRN